MDLQSVYQRVSTILDTIDFSALFPKFCRYPFALYTGQNICLNGRMLPYREEFLGNSAIELDGEFIAIWNVELDPVEDMERLAYSLVHEMFHCHQRVNGESRYPSDLTLLHYPEDRENFSRKYQENRCLTDAYEQHDFSQLQQFAAIRAQRVKQYPDMVRQEWRVETIEGLAEYVGLQALRQINADKFAAITAEYANRLREETELLFDIRRISYYSGALYFLCMKQLGRMEAWAFDSDKTAYEQYPVETDGVTVQLQSYDFVTREYAALCQKRRDMMAEYLRHAEYVPCRASICGYDPMNMFRVENRIVCSHFICLDENGKTKMIPSAVVLQLAEGAQRDIIGYYLPK